MNRKNFLKTLTIGAASTGVLLSACGGDAPKSNTSTAPENAASNNTAAPAGADCNDLSALTDAERKQRESVSYTVKSAEPEKFCGNCRFFQPGTQPNGCAGCQLFKGPVNPEGNCKSWFKKDA